MIRDIITNTVLLRKKSVKTDQNENQIIQDLWDSIPENGAGLAAPQINYFERIFVAKLSTGNFAFVNPEIVYNTEYVKLPSLESCLSIPGVSRVVGRYPEITISGKILSKEGFEYLSPVTFKNKDAFIIQHEIDHLDGVLITNIDEHPTAQKVKNYVLDRNRRVEKNRRKDNKSKTKKQFAKTSKNKKKEYKERRKEREVMKIRERFLLENAEKNDTLKT